MKRLSAVSVLIVLVIEASSPLASYSQERASGDEATIRALEERGRNAILAADTATLKILWSDRFIVNNPQSRISSTRNDVLDLVKRGLIRYSKFERTIEAIRQYGDIVIVMGAEEVSPIGDAPRTGETVRRRYTNIWMNEGGTWRLIARHANIVPPE